MATPAASGDYGYYVAATNQGWPGLAWAWAALVRNGQTIAYASAVISGEIMVLEGTIHVNQGDVVKVIAGASNDESQPGGAGSVARVDGERVWIVGHRETQSATSGPLTGTVNWSEGVKDMGTFRTVFNARHGGTLSPAAYSLRDVIAPTHGSIWIDRTSGTVFARTSIHFRTWDLAVLSENPAAGIAITVTPPDNAQQGDGLTTFTRVYETATVVQLTGPPFVACRPFDHWDDGWGGNVGTSPTIAILMDGDAIRKAVYQTALARPVLFPEPPLTRGAANVVAWNVIPGASYYLEWSASGSFSPVKGISGWRSATSYMVTGLWDGLTCFYRVKCRNSALQESAWSAPVFSRQDAVPPSTPGPPTDEGDFISTTTVQFFWPEATDPVSGVASYDLLVGTAPGAGNIFNGNVGTTRTWTIQAPTQSRFYARVRARDGVDNIGFWSGSSDGVTVDLVCPRLVRAVPASQDTVDVTFNEPVTNADQTPSYACTRGLRILGVLPLTATRYLVSTSPQQRNTSYTLTVSSTVEDRAGNPVLPPYHLRSFRGGSPTAARSWRGYH